MGLLTSRHCLCTLRDHSEQHFIWDMSGNLWHWRKQSREVQSFKHWKPQDPIQRHYLSTLVFSHSCGAEMWWALVCWLCVSVSLWMLSGVCMCSGVQWAKGPRCGSCAQGDIIGNYEHSNPIFCPLACDLVMYY